MDPVSQNSFKSCAGNFDKILIYGPKPTFWESLRIRGQITKSCFCCLLLRRGSYRIGAHFWAFWKMLLCAYSPRGFFESKYSDFYDVKWSTWWVSFDFFEFSKNFYVGFWRPYFRNRGQFTSCVPYVYIGCFEVHSRYRMAILGEFMEFNHVLVNLSALKHYEITIRWLLKSPKAIGSFTFWVLCYDNLHDLVTVYNSMIRLFSLLN